MTSLPSSSPSENTAASPTEPDLPSGSAVKPASSAAERCDASSSPPAAPSFSTPSWRVDGTRRPDKLFGALNSWSIRRVKKKKRPRTTSGKSLASVRSEETVFSPPEIPRRSAQTTPKRAMKKKSGSNRAPLCLLTITPLKVRRHPAVCGN